MNSREVTPGIVVADQPTEAELAELSMQGFSGVVNLRHDGEPEQPLDTRAEGTKARAAGLDYHAFPVGSTPLSAEGVASVSKFIDEHTQDSKVLVHCRKGGRAAAMVLLHHAAKNQWPADESIQRGADMGLKVEGNLRMLIEDYLRRHPPNA